MVTAAPILMDSPSAPSPRPTSAPVPAALVPAVSPTPAGDVLIEVEHLDFFYGTSQALQGALLADSLDVGGGAINQNLSAVAPQDVNSLEGIGVVCSFDTANSPATGSVTLNLVLQKLPLP